MAIILMPFKLKPICLDYIKRANPLSQGRRCQIKNRLPEEIILDVRSVSIVSQFCLHWMSNRQSYKTFILTNKELFPFFAVKLGHFIIKKLFCIINKHAN